ncbi:MAG TPA: DUF1223 domain-containing protein [Terriglobales bacterium]|nr:DUF1223 domain-containing protein [Terriglobales bacterium]
MSAVTDSCARTGSGCSSLLRWRRTQKLCLLVVSCFALTAFSNPAGDRSSSASPVLLELFTSEGCSSCPPVDAYVQKLDSAQPVPGAELIVLSEHVDYWDHDGWKDPYSSHFFTERQENYVRALRIEEPYTPQIIVDGTTVLRGDSAQIGKMLTAAATGPRIPVEISSVVVEPGSSPTVRAHVHVAAVPKKYNADVMLALALDHAESQVLHGENGGKRLSYVAVVEDMKKIGKIEKDKAFSRDVEIKADRGTDAKNLRVIAFVQEGEAGKVLGAAMQKPE